MNDFPKTGKIQNGFFKARVFPYCGKFREEVTVGPEYGVDLSVIDIHNGMAMLLTSDPLSLIPTLGLRESAWLSVQLMANDMATSGFGPMYAQFTLNLPNTLGADDFEQYWKFIHEYCDQLGIAITGGHTGCYDGLTSTVAGGGTMITVAPNNDVITSKGAQPGDMIIMTKECALLATAILSLSFPETVKKKCGVEVYNKGCDLFYQTSAVQAGLIAGEVGRQSKGVTAMHDITEGGIMGALYELAHASACGLIVDNSKIPIGDVQLQVGHAFGIDPTCCVGAGSMIITAKHKAGEYLLSRLQEAGIPAQVIGTVVERLQGVTITHGDQIANLDQVLVDPYWNAFFNAYREGWK